MKIDCVVVGCYKHDYWLARICVASIRYWYPDIPIYLLKDIAAGEFSTKTMQDLWDVNILDTPYKKFGSPISKLEIFLIKENKRVFFVDSDIIFIGPVIEELNKYDQDFIMSPTRISNPRDPHIKKHYYDIDLLKRDDPDFEYPGWAFNTGQFVTSTGLIKRQDFQGEVEYQKERVNFTGPDYFKLYDQGYLSYLIPKLQQKNRISVKGIDFKIYGSHDDLKKIDVDEIMDGQGVPKIIHYAGTKKPFTSMYPKGDLLKFYENYYFSKLRFGSVLKLWYTFKRFFTWLPKQPANLLRKWIPAPVKDKMKKSLEHKSGK